MTDNNNKPTWNDLLAVLAREVKRRRTADPTLTATDMDNALAIFCYACMSRMWCSRKNLSTQQKAVVVSEFDATIRKALQIFIGEDEEGTTTTTTTDTSAEWPDEIEGEITRNGTAY